jgi:hypothetical protein
VEGKKNVAVIKYRDALNDLEHLVVQRLLELTKLNVNNIGEFKLANFIVITLNSRRIQATK